MSENKNNQEVELNVEELDSVSGGVLSDFSDGSVRMIESDVRITDGTSNIR